MGNSLPFCTTSGARALDTFEGVEFSGSSRGKLWGGAETRLLFAEKEDIEVERRLALGEVMGIGVAFGDREGVPALLL